MMEFLRTLLQAGGYYLLRAFCAILLGKMVLEGRHLDDLPLPCFKNEIAFGSWTS